MLKRDTHTYQWQSLKSAHRLAYLTSQVLFYSRGASRNVKALIFFCKVMSKDNNNMPNMWNYWEPSPVKMKTNIQEEKKKRIEL